MHLGPLRQTGILSYKTARKHYKSDSCPPYTKPTGQVLRPPPQKRVESRQPTPPPPRPRTCPAASVPPSPPSQHTPAENGEVQEGGGTALRHPGPHRAVGYRPPGDGSRWPGWGGGGGVGESSPAPAPPRPALPRNREPSWPGGGVKCCLRRFCTPFKALFSGFFCKNAVSSRNCLISLWYKEMKGPPAPPKPCKHFSIMQNELYCHVTGENKLCMAGASKSFLVDGIGLHQSSASQKLPWLPHGN